MTPVYVSPAALTDIDVEGLVGSFDIQTEAGKAALTTRLSNPTTDEGVLNARADQLRQIKGLYKKGAAAIQDARRTLKETEADTVSVATAADDERHAEYYNQILWSPTNLFADILNQGWILEIIVFLRTLLLPGLAALLPLFVFIVPLVLSFAFEQKHSFTDYIRDITKLVTSASPSLLGPRRFVGRGDYLEKGEQVTHILLGLGALVFSAWSQVSSALSMRKIVADMRRRAESVRRFTAATETLATALNHPLPADWRTWATGSLGLFGEAWLAPTRVQQVLTLAGELDMLVAVTAMKRTTFVQWGPNMSLKDLYHPGTGAKRIYNSIQMGGSTKQHVLLTGPNRGGKSTVLKSLGAAVLMSQTLGVVFARRATLPLFSSIITALSPADVLGKMSLFESEIEFAKDVKSRLGPEPMFLMMDEIFHGTNAVDGAAAARIFLDQLYAHQGPVFSVISTHYMELPESYKENHVQALCMDARQDSKNPDLLEYTYRLCEGINRCSSVREILRERGLCGPEETKNTAPASKV